MKIKFLIIAISGMCLAMVEGSHGNYPAVPNLHRAALKMHQSSAAKLALKYQINFPAIFTVYWMHISQSTCKLLGM